MVVNRRKEIKMKKINVLGIAVKCYDEREESLITAIKMDLNEFYKTYKNSPSCVGDAYYMLFGKITSLFFMELINDEDYGKISDRLFKLYRFTKNHK